MRGVHGDATVACQPVVSVDGYAAFNSITINGSGNEVAVAPGSTVTVNFNWVMGNGGCPNCVTQVYIGLQDMAPYTCVHDGMEGDSGASSITFTAPSTPGLYYIGTAGSWQFSCIDVTGATPDRRVGLIYVQ